MVPTTAQFIFIVGLPIASVVIIFVLFNYIWTDNAESVLPVDAAYQAVPDEEENASSSGSLQRLQRPLLCVEGEATGDYNHPWTDTFDLWFLVGMILMLVMLLFLSWMFNPVYFSSPKVWFPQLLKPLVVIIVSFLGGCICRRFCECDEKGYLVTNKNSSFKVNYTRKIQHFAAYMVPLTLRTSSDNSLLGLLWADFFTMLAFLLMIKPIRENIPFFMLQFNSLDRPEDRPHTLKWIILGNILPGFIILLFFKWLLGRHDATPLVFIIVFITGIGDGLAEPIGILFGRHKYCTRSYFSSRKYTRSWEGSSCVFLSGMFFPAILYSSFENFLQLALSMLILPWAMAYAEATAPHSMDTAVLMTGCGLILYLILLIA